MKIREYKIATEKFTRYEFICPGCKTIHCISSSWKFNGDHEKPTFSPSVLYREFDESRETHPKGVYVCHSYVENGNIRYLGDCDHSLKGQTVPLPDL